MTKIMNAQAILKEKGYVQNKFDTNGFLEAVADFFILNDVDSRLLLVPFRFLDIKNGEEENGVYKFYNPFSIEEDEVKRGWKNQSATNKRGEPEYVTNLFYLEFEDFQKQKQAGIIAPRIIVDKPFFENAAQTLRLMGGFVVEKQMKKRTKLYWVTLI